MTYFNTWSAFSKLELLIKIFNIFMIKNEMNVQDILNRFWILFVLSN
jgi:hypothetical protein